jgi:polyhydroxyalkanoate synthesis regulator protein
MWGEEVEMSARKAAAAGEDGGKPVAIVKKYANRRLYNTATSSYVTLDELSRMLSEGE